MVILMRNNILVIVVLLSLSLVLANADFTVRNNDCLSSETPVFRMSGTSNAHIANASYTSYPVVMCLNGSFEVLKSVGVTNAPNSIIGISSDSNAHADISSNNYPVLYIANTSVSLNCGLGTCNDPILTLSSATNAHVSNGSYDYNLCCGPLNLDSDGDGFFTLSANSDCDDSNPNINPTMTESFNGLDDDCDGEVDEGFFWKQRLDSGSCSNLRGVLNCAGSVTVYQRISSQRLFSGANYNFSIDFISGSNFTLNIIGSSSCIDKILNSSMNWCSFTYDGENNLTTELIFSSDTVVDNASLYQLSGSRLDSEFLSNNVKMNITDFLQNSPASCCPNDYCWNGKDCINSEIYMTNTTKLPLFLDNMEQGYRCIASDSAADWVYSEVKSTPYNLQNGYCPRSDMCLVSTSNINTNYIEYGCVEDRIFTGNDYVTNHSIKKDEFGEYPGLEQNVDFLCNNGSWTSRTKELALMLIKIGENSTKPFVVFCDNPQNKGINESSLNYYYNDYSKILYNNLAQGSLFNNFCTLIIDDNDGDESNCVNDNPNLCISDTFSVDDTVIIASSLNTYLTKSIDGTSSTPDVSEVMQTLFGHSCLGISASENFVKCSDNPTNQDNLYFNNNTWSFVYSKSDLLLKDGILTVKLTVLESISEFFHDVYNFIINLISRTDSGLRDLDPSIISEEDLFSKIYYAYNENGKTVEGVRQKKYTSNKIDLVDYAKIRYYNISICTNTTTNFKLNLSTESQVYFNTIVENSNCNVSSDNTTTNLFISSVYPKNIDPIWYDLTSRLRIQN